MIYQKKEILLHPNELSLILAIRKHQHGELTLKIRDGLPHRLVKLMQFEDLGGGVDN